MNRRHLISAIGGAMLAPSGGAFAGQRRRIAIVGAGIFGASLAFHLAKQGADVIVLEKERAPGLGCTQGAFATLIADRIEGPRHLSDLYGLAVLDWRRLEREMAGRIAVQWGGMLRWAHPGAASEALNAEIEAARVMGAIVQQVSVDQLRELAPGLTPGAIGCALYRPLYGSLDPISAVRALTERATQLGAEFRYGCTVKGVQRDLQGRITALETDRGVVAADAFVIAAGAGAQALAESAGARAPTHLVSGTLAHSRPLPPLLSRVLNAPEISIKQDPDGRIVAGADYRPDAADTDISDAYGESLLATAARIAPSLRAARLERMTIGYVPIPEDHMPIIGFTESAPNLYVLVSMSGITFAPLLGSLAADEILGGIPNTLLAPYRPSRFH